MEEALYKSLAAHLDRLADGFAPSTVGAELKLLRRLFSPDEAALAVQLTLTREGAETIAVRAGLPLAVAEQRLESMASRGLIFSVQRDGRPTVYQAAPWNGGIIEFQVDRLTPAYLRDLNEYRQTVEPRAQPTAIPQMRVVPVARSIETRSETLPYERVYEMVREHERYAVAPCICRRGAKIAGKGCDAAEESCLWFGDGADYYVRNRMGRAVSQAEVMEILARADASNLVLQATNSKSALFVCCCCGCCCGGLLWLKSQPRPADAAASAFVAALKPETCEGCWTCIDRCQMGALSKNGDHAALNADRCIGCGLCVSTCKSEALYLARVPGREPAYVPETAFDMWREAADARAAPLKPLR